MLILFPTLTLLGMEAKPQKEMNAAELAPPPAATTAAAAAAETER